MTSGRDVVFVKTFPANPDRVATARAWVEERCVAAGVATPIRESLVLLVSEIVTNVITHTRSHHLIVRMTLTADVVQIAVDDSDPGPPLPRRATESDTGGRGLALVDVLADAWGVHDLDDGKSVWFRVGRGET